MTTPPEILDPFLAAADAAAARPEVDAEIARELMAEAAAMLHNSLALDALDPHDLGVVVAALADDLTSADPGAAVRARADAEATALHDPAAAQAAYLVTVQVLGL